jgi:hypothetical protein
MERAMATVTSGSVSRWAAVATPVSLHEAPRPRRVPKRPDKNRRILRKLRCCPWRAGQLAKAIHALEIHTG